MIRKRSRAISPGLHIKCRVRSEEIRDSKFRYKLPCLTVLNDALFLLCIKRVFVYIPLTRISLCDSRESLHKAEDKKIQKTNLLSAVQCFHKAEVMRLSWSWTWIFFTWQLNVSTNFWMDVRKSPSYYSNYIPFSATFLCFCLILVLAGNLSHWLHPCQV